MRSFLEILPWLLLALGLLGIGVSTFLIPFIMAVFARVPKGAASLGSMTEVDVLIPAHDEADNLLITIQSLRESCAKAGVKLRILVGADACTDATVHLAREAGVEVFEYQYRSKWKVLRALHAESRAERVALVDAGIRWTDQTVVEVWKAWDDDVLGVAPGYRPAKAGFLGRMHWALEATFKRIENLSGGPVAVHGATVFYRREELGGAMDALKRYDDWKNDDVAIPLALRVLYPCLRLVYCKAAAVEDRGVLQAAGERGRRMRMARGNLEVMTQLLPLLRGPGLLRACFSYLRRAGRIFWAWWALLLGTGAGLLMGIAPYEIAAVLLVLLVLGILGITGLASAFVASLAAPVMIFPAFAGRVGWRDSEKWLRRPPSVEHPVSWVMYIAVITGGWIWAALYFREAWAVVPMQFILGWALATALSTVFLLSLMDYFGIFVVLPRRREIFTLSLALPIPGIFWKFFMFNIYGIEVVRMREILIAAPIVAIIAFIYRLFEHRRIFRKGPLILAATLSEDEFRRLDHYFTVSGLRDRLKLVAWDDVVAKGLVPYSIVYSRSALRDLRSDRGVLEAIFSGLKAIELRRLVMQLTGMADIRTLDTWFLLQVSTERAVSLRAYDAFRMVFEPICALVLLVLLLPFLLVLALIIRLTSPGPALYTQERSGRLGHRFRLLKFRTMRLDAEAGGAVWAQENDPRVTAIGQVLRRLRFDELPQLWNIICGHLSFVGPRPERPEIVEELVTEIPLFPLRMMVKPGVTGWAQVNYGYVGSVEESRLKLAYDLHYIMHRSLWFDLLILLRTISILWKGGSGR
jgi:lipopolysaccharide/colanic/teichoic acid biosynthesis glycosyltransferase/cellulose synthase/poly-beta-1,6-N-acetylglucosamine synthase-like glycosyltransferase